MHRTPPPPVPPVELGESLLLPQPKPQASGTATTHDQVATPLTCFRPCAFVFIDRHKVLDSSNFIEPVLRSGGTARNSGAIAGNTAPGSSAWLTSITERRATATTRTGLRDEQLATRPLTKRSSAAEDALWIGGVG